MAFLFRTYFMWDFFNMIALIVIAFISAIINTCKPRLAMLYFIAFTALVACSAIFLYFLGLVWRFSGPGMLVSGESIGDKPESTSAIEWEKIIDDAGFQIHGGQVMKI